MSRCSSSCRCSLSRPCRRAASPRRVVDDRDGRRVYAAHVAFVSAYRLPTTAPLAGIGPLSRPLLESLLVLAGRNRGRTRQRRRSSGTGRSERRRSSRSSRSPRCRPGRWRLCCPWLRSPRFAWSLRSRPSAPGRSCAPRLRWFRSSAVRSVAPVLRCAGRSGCPVAPSRPVAPVAPVAPLLRRRLLRSLRAPGRSGHALVLRLGPGSGRPVAPVAPVLRSPRLRPGAPITMAPLSRHRAITPVAAATDDLGQAPRSPVRRRP